MKKMSFVLTLVVLSALLLAACGGAGNNANGNGTPDAGAGNTGGTLPTSETGAGSGGDMGTTPGAGDTGGAVDGTPTVSTGGDAGGTGADTTPTTDAGAGAGTTDATPTVDAAAGAGSGATDTTPTAEAGAGTGTESTPQAEVAGETGNFALLSDLIQTNVNSSDGQQVGTVDGFVINRPIAVTGGTGTGSDAGAGAQATPTSEIGKGSVGGSTGTTGGSATMAGDAPQISYVLVNVTGGTSGSDTSGSGTAGQATATPAAGGDASGSGSTGTTGQAGSAVAIPWEAFHAQVGEAGAAAGTDAGQNALVLDMDASALAGAPVFDETAVVAQGWDTDAQAYWSGQGLSIPATGAAGTEGEPVVLREIGGMNVMSQDGQSFGQVTDFVVDLTTGELAYAILSGAGTGMSSMYAVPVEFLSWSAGADASGTGLGEFSASFPQTAFDAAPSFTSVDELDLSGDWNTEVDTYWETAGGMSQ